MSGLSVGEWVVLIFLMCVFRKLVVTVVLVVVGLVLLGYGGALNHWVGALN